VPKRFLFAVVLVLFACHSKHHGSEKREGRNEEEEEEEEEAFGVPISSCACTTGDAVITLHAPREDRVLWWAGVKRGKSALDELAVFSGEKQRVISPKGDTRMLMACDGDVFALVRQDAAAGWRVAHNAKGDAIPIWSANLPKPLDVTGIDAPLVHHTKWNVGCRTLPSTGKTFDVQLQGGVRGTLSMRDGTWTAK
jgi:hypothetical protein